MGGLGFQGKARNLQNLQGILRGAKILDLLIFKTSEIKRDALSVAKSITASFSDEVIIRSAAQNEDEESASNAGAFLTIPCIHSQAIDSLLSALERVSESMGEGEHELLVQPMLQGITLSGVVMSVDKEDSAPYVVVNFEESAKSDGITSGSSTKHQTFYHFRHASLPDQPRLRALIETIFELEAIFDCEYLDVEFAFAKEGESEQLYILQVRPIAKRAEILHQEVFEALEKIRIKFEKLNRPHPNLLGNRTIFGVMPDWNPAEIIGIKPRYLALSLYKELVTDSVWAYQRSNYGYRNLRSHPLLVSFVGIPYIDTRISFNSFIPENLNSKIATKLANFYLDKLANSPENHDKVEFEIILSCYHFNLPQKLGELQKEGFSQEELKRLEFALLELTNAMIDPIGGLYKKDLEKIKKLEEKFQSIESSELADIDKIYWGIEYCKRYGTLPFAGVARAAFVAVQILDSLVQIGFLNSQEKEDFLASLNTVSKKLSERIHELSSGKISKEEFLKEYGHLRAGTYSILSPSYKEAFESYFGDIKACKSPLKKEFCLSCEKKEILENLLVEHGLRISAQGLFDFIKEAIEGRELVKFGFTKVLSRVLEMVEAFGGRLEIPKEEMAHLDIKILLGLYANLEGITAKERLLEDILFHKEEFALARLLKLPPIILDSKDIYSYVLPSSHPNFIGSGRVQAEVVDESMEGLGGELEGKIVCVKSADPGYDFLFTKGIAGLITCYGGVNSHMAIRCAEAGICAVIGAGEEYFERWRRARFLELDSASCKVEIL